MKKMVSILPSLLLMCLLGCSTTSPNHRHIGTWKCESETSADDFTLTFGETTLSYFDVSHGVITNSYTIDYTKNPIWLDVDTMHGIMEFIDNDTFRFAGDVELHGVRPLSFDEAADIQTFRRVK